MKNFSSNLLTLLTVGLMATSTFACGGRGNGGGGGGFGGGNGGGGYNRPVRVVQRPTQSNNFDQFGSTGQSRPNGGQASNGRALEPFHSTHNPLPTDSFFIVSLKEYGTSDAAKFIAAFNGMEVSDSLANVQRLHMPSISKTGEVNQSRAPLSDQDLADQRNTTTTNATQVSASTQAPAASLPSIASGSTLKIDGQALGQEKGTVRLKVSGVAMPVSVIEWTADSAKIRLPEFEVASATKAEIEVLRADGTVAAKSGLNLTPAVAKSPTTIAKSN